MGKSKLVIILMVLLSVCSFSNTLKKVGVIISNTEPAYFKEIVEGIEVRGRKSGVEITVKNSEDSITKELWNIREMITEGVDIVIINPTDSSAVGRGIKELNKAKIPVISIDRKAKSGEVIAHIESNNLQGGKLLGEYLKNKLERNSKLVELKGIADTSATLERSEGFSEEVENYFDIIARKSGGFDREKSYEIMKSILQEEAEIDVVYAHNDLSALGAIDAIKESGRDILVVGFDGTKEGIGAIRGGDLLVTVGQNPYEIGYSAMEKAIKSVGEIYLEKESIKLDVKLIDIELLKKEGLL